MLTREALILFMGTTDQTSPKLIIIIIINVLIIHVRKRYVIIGRAAHKSHWYGQEKKTTAKGFGFFS